MTTPRVLGCVMARDEWPLLGLAIDHALNGHVDHVVVVDHGSVDATAEGLRRLQGSYPDRVTVVRLHDAAFTQEAVTALMVEVGASACADWIYVFDADEFILPGGGRDLPAVLRGVPPSVDSVRYEVHNWVIPATFDEADVADYADVVLRAQPDAFHENRVETPDAIARGSVNFFDVPFPSKVITRRPTGTWLSAGAHLVKFPAPRGEHAAPPTVLRAGHLPLLSRNRLERKARYGQALIDDGFPPGHGWQWQVLRRLQVEGRLDEFWQAHIVPARPGAQSRALPHVGHDGELGEALSRAAARVTEWSARQPTDDAADREAVSGDVAVHAVRGAQRAGDDWKARAEALELALADVRRQRDELQRTVARMRAESEERLGQTDAERERLTGRITGLVRDLDSIQDSRSWRVTAPMRGLRERLRG